MGGRARGAGPAVGGISAGGTRRSPWRPSEIPVRRRGPRPESLRSFEYLPQPSFIALLYGRDPGLFVDQIEDVDHQGPSGGVEIDPQGTRGRRDDDRKRRESTRSAHVERPAERRVGKACVSPCSTRGSPHHTKKQKNT